MAASPITAKPYFDLESFNRSFECYIEKMPLTEAVTCVPCMHKINLTSAQYFLGSMEGDVCSNPRPCGLCRRVIQAYYPDHTVSDFVKRVLDLENVIRENTVDKSEEEQKVEKEMAYPGKLGKFVFTGGNRGIVFGPQMNFGNSESGAVLRAFQVFNHIGGIALQVHFRPNDKLTTEYLLNQGMDLKESDIRKGTFLVFSTSDQMKKLFAIVTKYNEFPEEHLLKMQAIVEAGKMI